MSADALISRHSYAAVCSDMQIVPLGKREGEREREKERVEGEQQNYKHINFIVHKAAQLQPAAFVTGLENLSEWKQEGKMKGALGDG